jgi:hypothetical protein
MFKWFTLALVACTMVGCASSGDDDSDVDSVSSALGGSVPVASCELAQVLPVNSHFGGGVTLEYLNGKTPLSRDGNWVQDQNQNKSYWPYTTTVLMPHQSVSMEPGPKATRLILYSNVGITPVQYGDKKRKCFAKQKDGNIYNIVFQVEERPAGGGSGGCGQPYCTPY